MSTVEAIGADELVDLDRKVDAAEGEGIMARWEFGRELLKKRKGQQLPHGLLDELVEQTGKSRRELIYRVQFAERFKTTEEVCNTLHTFGSWREIVHDVLPTTKRDKLAPLMSSETDQWSTPQDLFDELDAEFGFQLDVCADQANAKCERYFTEEDDGLAQDWTGTCWMNPPYGEVIGDWVAKAKAAAEQGATVVCLVPARVDTSWWWDNCRYGEIRFLKGRLRFGGAETSAPFPSAVVIFGRPERVVWWER